MISPEKEKIKMKTDGEDYQNYIQDIIGDHKSKTSRTSIDFLIIRLCDKYDGLSNFLATFCLQLLDFAINSSEITFNPNSNINESYNLLCDPNLHFRGIIHNFNQESLIDISLILLCSLKNQILKNKSLVSKLKLIFDNYINNLHNVSSELIKFDISLIYDVFITSFMENDETEKVEKLENEYFMKRLDFLFICLMDYEKTPGISAQAAKTITTIFNETNTDNIDNKYISHIFKQLILHIENIEITIYLDVLIDIICSCKIEENLLTAISLSTRRILKEIKSPVNSQDSKSSIIISKCINIIKSILKENNLTCKENIENDIIIPITDNSLNLFQVEKSLEPLMSYLKNPSKIDFDEELLDILKTLLNNSETVTPLSKEIFSYLGVIIDKNSGMDIQMFKILNLYIVKDDGFIFNNENNLKNLIEILINSLDYDEEVEFSPVCGSILMQILPNVNFLFLKFIE